MNIILLSGGSGRRLWPLSNDVRSKQFIQIFQKEDGTYESMLQRMYRNILEVDPEAQITIATAKNQVSTIHNQIGENVAISVEPFRRDTFGAIALACSYLQDVLHVSKEEPVIVCPVDPYVEKDYFEALKELSALAQTGEENLYLLGIEPTYPSAKYGYIIPKTKEEVSAVESFKEKPSEEVAQSYIEKGALWNGGIFAFQLDYLMQKAHSLLSFEDYYDLYRHFDTIEKISFDYAVVEKEEKIGVMRFHGEWKDLGTWNTFTEAMQEPTLGNVRMDEKTENTHVINELDIPILVMGMKDAVIATSAEGILVSTKKDSSYIKPYVDVMEQKVMFAEKSWGSFQVKDIEEDSMTIKVTLNAGHQMNYHAHNRRDEVWTVISGKGRTIVDGMEQPVQPGDVITIEKGCKHTIIADTDLKLIEVQLGKEIDVKDKVKYPLDE